MPLWLVTNFAGICVYLLLSEHQTIHLELFSIFFLPHVLINVISSGFQHVNVNLIYGCVGYYLGSKREQRLGNIFCGEIMIELHLCMLY